MFPRLYRRCWGLSDGSVKCHLPSAFDFLIWSFNGIKHVLVASRKRHLEMSCWSAISTLRIYPALLFAPGYVSPGG